MQLDRRKIRGTLGSRTTRRQGTKSRHGSRRAKPARLMRAVIARIERGELKMEEV